MAPANNPGEVLVVLPWPPSLNSMYFNRKSGKGRGRILTPDGRTWKLLATSIIKISRGYRFDLYPKGTQVKVDYLFKEPDRRVRDFDNLLKIINDSLQESGIMRNDSQIRAGTFAFGDRVKGGMVEVRLSLLA